MSDPMQSQIDDILNQNKVDDLKRFLAKRQCLNKTNVCLNYLFHFIQSAGIFTTTLAAGYNIKELVWGGIALNIVASLINIFEQTNNTLSKRLMKDIVAIKQGKYVDEGLAVEAEKNQAEKNQAESAQSSKVPVEPDTDVKPNNLSVPLLDSSV